MVLELFAAARPRPAPRRPGWGCGSRWSNTRWLTPALSPPAGQFWLVLAGSGWFRLVLVHQAMAGVEPGWSLADTVGWPHQPARLPFWAWGCAAAGPSWTQETPQAPTPGCGSTRLLPPAPHWAGNTQGCLGLAVPRWPLFLPRPGLQPRALWVPNHTVPLGEGGPRRVHVTPRSGLPLRSRPYPRPPCALPAHAWRGPHWWGN